MGIGDLGVKEWYKNKSSDVGLPSSSVSKLIPESASASGDKSTAMTGTELTPTLSTVATKSNDLTILAFMPFTPLSLFFKYYGSYHLTLIGCRIKGNCLRGQKGYTHHDRLCTLKEKR